MSRRPTLNELIWPDDPADADLPVQWAKSVTKQVLDWVWRAFDALAVQLKQVDLDQKLEQPERNFVHLHYINILSLFGAETDGYPAIVPSHEPPEMETRSSAFAKPPANDLAFICMANPRWIWPLEAKVISTTGALAEYLHDVNDKFGKGIAAPLVGEGAMIGYLLVNDPTTVFANLASRLNQKLESIVEFSARPHRVSLHARTSAPDLRLHHLLMACVD
jgi:hypothetical protein